MGFVYAVNPATGKECLCCDFCGKWKGDIGIQWVKKIRCPHGWCQSYATCSECYKKKMHKKANDYHRDCKVQSDEYAKQEAKKRELLDSGRFVRCAALAHDGEWVKVLFRGLVGERAFFMKRETYNAIPLLEPATYENFAEFGNIYEASNTDLYDPEMPSEAKTIIA